MTERKHLDMGPQEYARIRNIIAHQFKGRMTPLASFRSPSGDEMVVLAKIDWQKALDELESALDEIFPGTGR